MNLPNKLTVLRMCLIPVFLVFMLASALPHNYLWATLVFVAASLTDLLDGKIARKYNLITDFGKFMDPLADKLLVTAAMIMLIGVQMAPAVIVFIIIARELAVTGLRLIAAPKGLVIAADRWGKYKTVSQMVWVVYSLVLLWLVENSGFLLEESLLHGLLVAYDVLLALVTVLTIFSGFNYLWNNRAALKEAP